jgi:hypothetical protein
MISDRIRDYQDFTSKDTPQVERRKLNIGDIWSNAARCARCGDTVRSRNRHDYRTCKCGALAVDGGSWYARRVFDTKRVYGGAFENLIEMYDHIEEA